MLTQGKHIPVGIFEPRNLVAAGRSPDSQLLVIDPRVFFKMDSSLLKPGCHFFDIGNLPAEDCIGRGSEILGFGNPNHGFTGSHNQGKHIVADESKSQLIFVKASGLRRIFRRNEADNFAGSQHLQPSSSIVC